MTSDPDNVPAISSDLTDRTLGDFHLIRRLGVGGMAEVYLAEQLSLKRMVAVKLLLDDAVSGKNDTLLQRFEQEARAAGGLSDPNIVQVYMIGCEDNRHYIVQEYVQGQNLSECLKRNGPPEFLKGLKWMKQVASALRAADAAGVVHRDIKPENIMLTAAEDAKVTDFGLAQLNEPTEKLNLTQQGTTMGTPWYMSPEQIQGNKLDHRSDQYSFGVTCYHMFAGQPPFPGKNAVSVAVKHLNDEPAPLREHRRDLPAQLCEVIHRLMAKQPEDRFQSIEELQTALADLDSVTLNEDLVLTGSFGDWVRSSLPSAKMALAGLLGCCLLGAAVGRRIYQPTRLNSSQEFSYPKIDSSAAQQYAKALLDHRNPAAWEAVFKNWEKSEEAVWARLHLGLLHLGKPSKRNETSQLFDDMYRAALKIKNRELQMMSLLAKITLATEIGDTETAENILTSGLEEYRDEFANSQIRIPELEDAFASWRKLAGT